MRILPALLALSVTAGITFAAQPDCQTPIYCPCGRTDKNITVCFETVSKENEPCEKWSRCKSCQDGLNRCLECEDGYKGPLCSITKEQNAKFRQKRQIPSKVFGRIPRRPENRPMQRRNQRSARNCPSLNSPKLGSIRCTSDDQQKTCVGKCLPGYEFENHESDKEITLKCQGHGWTPFTVFPPCRSGGHCDLAVQGAGSFNCTTGMQGTRCDVKCANHYAGRYYCYPGKEWEPHLPHCVRPNELILQPCRCEYGASCDGSGNCVCPAGRTGTFCETRVSEKHTCNDPGFISNGFRRHSDGSDSSTRHTFEEGESVVYGCRSDDFALRGSSLLTCRNDGTWSSPLPTCFRSPAPPRTTCPDPGQVANAARWNSDGSPSTGVQAYRVGQSVVYTCHPGFSLRGRSFINCLDSGVWSGRAPDCSRVTPPSPVIRTTTDSAPLIYCLNPGSIPNGRVMHILALTMRAPKPPDLDEEGMDEEYPQGSRLKYSCNSGYTLEGSDILACETSGFWSAYPPSCIKSDPVQLSYCQNPGSIPNGRVMQILALNTRTPRPPDLDDEGMDEEYPQGSRLQYFCNSGYTLEGSGVLTCETTGFWSAKPPSCIGDSNSPVLFCSNPGPIFNGRFRVISSTGVPRSGPDRPTEDDIEYPEGTRLTYNCDDEYILQGTYSLKCQSTGHWSAEPPTCVEDCGRSFMQTTRRILDGVKTVAGEWPWVVAVSVLENNFTRLICGGVVLNSRTVMTAAHCLTGAKRFILYFGKLHRNNKNDDAEVLVRRSTRVIIHPDFSNSTKDSDIGLVIFEPRIRFSVRVQPICLPTMESAARNLMTGSTGYVSGWGETERRLPAEELLLASLPVQSDKACIESYKRQNINVPLTKNMFCAGLERGQHSACSGDSGSPLAFYDSNAKRYTVEGLVSFGVEGQCGLPGRYTIFTKVFPFLPWIFRNLK